MNERKNLQASIATNGVVGSGGKMNTKQYQMDETSATGRLTVYKYLSLVFLSVQTAILIVCLRYARTRGGNMFQGSTAVALVELIKLVASLIVIFIQEKSWTGWKRHLYDNLAVRRWDWITMSVPSIVYVIQNNLIYVAISNLDAATFQVTYQLKILATAVISVVMLNSTLSHRQWAALLMLFIGVSIVQLNSQTPSQKTDQTVQRPLLGLFCIIICSGLSGFAGVYFEKVLKGTKQSLWLRNVQLGVIGIFFALLTVLWTDYHKICENGLFFGFDNLVCFIIFMQALGGIMVALAMKYADNILKSFSTSAAIVLSSLASIYIFDVTFSLSFLFGAFLVMVSVCLYGIGQEESKKKV